MVSGERQIPLVVMQSLQNAIQPTTKDRHGLLFPCAKSSRLYVLLAFIVSLIAWQGFPSAWAQRNINDATSVKLVGVEAAGEGIATGRHSASLLAGRPGVLHGNRTYLLQNADGQIAQTHSVSAGLDYPGVGPEHAWLKDSGRADYVSVTDDEALAAFNECCRIEGIIPALESCHALAHAATLAPTLPRETLLLVNLSGRGDKDMATVAERSGLKFYCRPDCDPSRL